MTTVLAGGDSFIWGSELSDSPHGGLDGYSKNTFPALLADNYVCVAYPGIGNTEISNRVKEACRHAKFDLVIVSWTWPSRDDNLTSDREINELAAYLKYHDQPYMFTCADNCVVTESIDLTNWFMFPPAEEEWLTTTPRGFYQWATENKYPIGPDRHPLEQAHIDAANLMQEKFNEMVKKSV